MAQVANVTKVMDELRKRMKEAEGQNKVTVVVGYSAAYAVYVHENIEMKLEGIPRRSGIGVYWGPKGQAKFLEEPARRLAKDLGDIVGKAMKRGVSLVQSLVIAGLRLQRESQLLVPVEYGYLKNSAFTEVER